MPRSTTLWSFEPVKYCSAAPNDLAGTTRRSICKPRPRRIDIFVSPRPMTVASSSNSAELIHRGVGVVGVDEQVDVADRFAAAAVAAGHFHLPDAFQLAHVGEQLLHDLVGVGPVHPLVGLGGQVDAGQDLVLRLLAEAFERLHLVGLAGGAEHRRAR